MKAIQKTVTQDEFNAQVANRLRELAARIESGELRAVDIDFNKAMEPEWSTPWVGKMRPTGQESITVNYVVMR